MSVSVEKGDERPGFWEYTKNVSLGFEVCIVQERGDLLYMYVGMLLIEYKIKIIKKILCVCCCCGVAPPKRGKNWNPKICTGSGECQEKNFWSQWEWQ